jgi:hypothetical protein
VGRFDECGFAGGLYRQRFQRRRWPIDQALSTRTIRRQVQQVAGRLEAELSHEGKSASKAVPPGQNPLTELAAPRVLSLDDVYLHGKDQPDLHEACLQLGCILMGWNFIRLTRYSRPYLRCQTQPMRMADRR